MATLTITGTAADDTIFITASGPDSGSYSINGGPAVAFSGVTQVVVCQPLDRTIVPSTSARSTLDATASRIC